MNKTLLTISSALFAFLGTFLSAAFPADAQTVTLPLHFSHAGLTFAEPLIYTNQTTVKPATITFSVLETLQISKSQNANQFALLPTGMTLPMLPEQKPPSYETEELTPTPTVKVAATLASSPTDVPATPTTAAIVTSPSNTGGLDAEKLFNMSNAYRQARGLPAFQKDGRACSLAASRAPEIAGEVASGNMHAGLRARALPYWNTENIISMRNEEEAFNWWVNDKIHHDAIVGNYTYSCVACAGNSCAQEFTNFQPK